MSHRNTLFEAGGGGRTSLPSRSALLTAMILTGLALVFLPAVPAVAADCVDTDGDGFVTCIGCTAGGNTCGDCNEGAATAYFGAPERCDDNIDNDCDGNVNEGFHIGADCALCTGPDCGGASFCIDGVDCDTFSGDLCLTSSKAIDGFGMVCDEGGITESCASPLYPVAVWEVEGLGNGMPGNTTEPTCSDGVDNDCNGFIDLEDSECWAPELCDAIDNDGDGLIDEDFPLSSPGLVGAVCSSGDGACEGLGNWVCLGDGTDAFCTAIAKLPSDEGVAFGLTCADGKDNNCDGLTDLDDPFCTGFGSPELCGNLLDDDGDGFVDEGFPQIDQACSVGVGACAAVGQLVCKGDYTGIECNAVEGVGSEESDGAGTCFDFIDNDCDGLIDGADEGCTAAAAVPDLGVSCSLPYTHARPGSDCTGKHVITFGAEADGVALKADLLALGMDGTLLGIIEDVGNGEEAHLASRIDPDDFRVDTKSSRKGNRHTVFAPMPILRVTGTNGAVEDVAYCSIMPWLEVTAPNGQTISLNETSTLDVAGFVPLVDIGTLGLALDGVDILNALGFDPMDDFPTESGPLCTTLGECVIQIEAGCGDTTMVDVEITNLVVEGLDLSMVPDAKSGTEQPEQINTFSFTVSGLPAGGHIFYVNGQPLPLSPQLTDECLVDDLADAGIASAFGIQVDAPAPLEVFDTAPVFVEGTVCGGNEIDSLRVQGNDIPVGGQICTPGDGITSADECVLEFNEPIEATDLLAAVEGTAIGGTFHLGSNRVIVDATDDQGNRTFNTDVIFGLGEYSEEAKAATAQKRAFYEAGRRAGEAMGKEIRGFQKALGDVIEPAFVIGLEPEGAQDFFNEKCEDALAQFETQATANLTGKVFATVNFEPGCSCDLDNVPIVLEKVTFTSQGLNPTCEVDFRTGEIGVIVHLPDIEIQVGAHDKCEDEGLFGECIARTKLDVTAINQVTNLDFEFVITEEGIEDGVMPNPNTRVITWIIKDWHGTELFYDADCVGGSRDGEFCNTDTQCPGGTCGCTIVDGVCAKRGKDEGYDPVWQSSAKVECWGASLCNVFATIGAWIIEVFTLGFADGYEIVGIIDFGVTFQNDFQAELDDAEPDPLELEEIQINEETVASFEQGAFTAGDIDVTIEPAGLKVEVPATFMSLTLDPDAEETPGAVLTPAGGPGVLELIEAGDEISIGIADDVFNQLFAASRQAGSLEAFCTDGDGLTVENLLPADGDGGCDSIGLDDADESSGDAIAQGICHAVRGADCLGLSGPATVGACVGFSGGDCTTLGLLAKPICNSVPARNISADDSLLLCARQDMEPLLLFQDDTDGDNTVLTDLLLNDTNVVFAIDKANDGYTGELESLQGCFGAEGDAAPDCLLYAVCLDLTLKTRMGIDNSTCLPTQTGFVFALLEVIKTGEQPGVMCSAATEADDTLVTGAGIDSVVITSVSDAAESFTPPFCADGLTLGGILDFTSADAKMFAITTDEATPGFADFLFLTGGLGSP